MQAGDGQQVANAHIVQPPGEGGFDLRIPRAQQHPARNARVIGKERVNAPAEGSGQRGEAGADSLRQCKRGQKGARKPQNRAERKDGRAVPLSGKTKAGQKSTDQPGGKQKPSRQPEKKTRAKAQTQRRQKKRAQMEQGRPLLHGAVNVAGGRCFLRGDSRC